MITSISATLFFAGSIVMLWRVSMLGRELSTLTPFLPFLLYAILLNVRSAFLYYEVDFTVWWSLLELAVFFSYAWLLFIFVRIISKNVGKSQL